MLFSVSAIFWHMLVIRLWQESKFGSDLFVST